MLPEQGPEITVCDPHTWITRWYRVFGWPDFYRSLQIACCKWRSNRMKKRTPPESRLAQIVMEIGRDVEGNWSANPMLLEQLEGQIAATDDLAVRKVFAAYLAEP